MSNRPMLEAVAAELRRHGLPLADVARLLQELDDHMADLFAEQGGHMDERMHANEPIEARLGRPEALVAAALANRRQASIFGRHPILSFIVAPIPVAILSWIGLLLLWLGLLEATGWMIGEKEVLRDCPALRVYALKAIEIGMRFLSPALAGALLCWCADRAGMSWRWTLAATCLVALVAEALVFQVKMSAEPGHGAVVFGLGFPVLQWINLVQLLVPIAVGAAFLWRARTSARSGWEPPLI